MTKSEFANVMAYLGAVFPAFKPNERTAFAWLELLGPYPAEDVQAAAHHAARTHRYGQPTPAVLLEFLDGTAVRELQHQTDHHGAALLDKPMVSQEVRRFPSEDAERRWRARGGQGQPRLEKPAQNPPHPGKLHESPPSPTPP